MKLAGVGATPSFAAAAAGQDALDADVFVEVRPFDRVAAVEPLPLPSFNVTLWP